MNGVDIQREVDRYAGSAVEFGLLLDRLLSGGDLTPADLSLLEDSGIDRDDFDELELFDEVFELEVLEVYQNSKFLLSGESYPGPIVLVTGVGGPHVELVISESGRIEGAAYWSSDRARRVGHADMLAGHLFDLFDEVTS